MHFLLRTMPHAMLHLQSGKFDAADRLFHSVAQAWHTGLESDNDVRRRHGSICFLFSASGYQNEDKDTQLSTRAKTKVCPRIWLKLLGRLS